MSKLMWTEKYRPQTVEEVIGNKRSKRAFLKWLKKWKLGDKPVLLYGPPGLGKTTLVHIVARRLEYDLIEMNASDLRNKENVIRIAGRATTESSLHNILTRSKGTLILLDEIDGVYLAGEEDEGGIDAIIDISKASRVPIVLVANNPYLKDLYRKLRDDLYEGKKGFKRYAIRFERLGSEDDLETRVRSLKALINRLNWICEKEGIEADRSALEKIVEKSKGDVRSAINDLQMFAEGKEVLRIEDVELLEERNREYNVFEALEALFSSTTYDQAKEAIDSSELDYEELLYCVHENLPVQIKDLERLAKAYEHLSKADVFLGRIWRSGDWSLLRHVLEQIALAVTLPQGEFYREVRYQYPPSKRKLLGNRKRKLVDEVCMLIASKCHVSRRVAKLHFLPFISFILREEPTKGDEIAKWLGLGEEAIGRLRGF